jgi:hypothetical protein
MQHSDRSWWIVSSLGNPNDIELHTKFAQHNEEREVTKN